MIALEKDKQALEKDKQAWDIERNQKLKDNIDYVQVLVTNYPDLSSEDKKLARRRVDAYINSSNNQLSDIGKSFESSLR